jgi:hypothetical protein
MIGRNVCWRDRNNTSPKGYFDDHWLDVQQNLLKERKVKVGKKGIGGLVNLRKLVREISDFLAPPYWLIPANSSLTFHSLRQPSG